MGTEHSMVTTSELVLRNVPGYNMRLEHPEGYRRALSFVEDGTPDGGLDATEIEVRFASGSKTTTLRYSGDDKLYTVRQFNRDLSDANNNSVLGFTNVLILKTYIGGVPGDAVGLRVVETVGSGTGYFLCGGKYIEINWSRANKESQFIYTLKDGSELQLGVGKTYICIISDTLDPAFK